jgi:hypothetical protein
MYGRERGEVVAGVGRSQPTSVEGFAHGIARIRENQNFIQDRNRLAARIEVRFRLLLSIARNTMPVLSPTRGFCTRKRFLPNREDS